MPSDRFAVYEGHRERDPLVPVRVVTPNGTAFHVIHEDGLRTTSPASLMPLVDAIREAFRLAGRPLPDECE